MQPPLNVPFRRAAMALGLLTATETLSLLTFTDVKCPICYHIPSALGHEGSLLQFWGHHLPLSSSGHDWRWSWRMTGLRCGMAQTLGASGSSSAHTEPVFNTFSTRGKSSQEGRSVCRYAWRVDTRGPASHQGQLTREGEAGLRQGYEGDTGRGKPLTLGSRSPFLQHSLSIRPKLPEIMCVPPTTPQTGTLHGEAVLTWATHICDLELK